MSGPVDLATLAILHSLPPELLDTTVNFIPSCSDLISLAQTCSTFRDLVIPVHLHYRTVRCFVGNCAMWNHLLENPRRLKHVHTLELSLDSDLPQMYWRPLLSTEPPAQLPSSWESLALSALKQMTHLKSISWSFRHSRPNSVHTYSSFAEKCWDVVAQSCPELTKVSALPLGGCSRCLANRGPATLSKLFHLRRLLSLSYTCCCTLSGMNHELDAEPLLGFLAANLELQELRVESLELNTFCGTRIEGILSLHFPSLTSFRLMGKMGSFPMDSLLSFLNRHRHLESACVSVFSLNNPVLQSTNRPMNLKHLFLHSDYPTPELLALLMNLTTGQLDSLSILVHDLTDETLQALSVATGSALKALFIISMASFEWTQLMAVVGTTWACLRRLHLYWAPLTRGETEPAKLDDWIGPLHHFQQLTVLNVPQEIFQRLVVRDGPLDVNLRPDAVMKLTQACPTLRLLTCFGIFTNRARAALLYIRPMEEPAEQIEPNEPFVTDYTEEHATTLHLRAEVLSTSHVWRLYLIEGPTNQHLWKRFLPHWDSIKFADE